MLEPDATIDTRLVNGQVWWANGHSTSGFIVRSGCIFPDDVPEEDAWRTVNASGYIVLPGLVQLGSPCLPNARESAIGGVTTALATLSAQTVDQLRIELAELADAVMDFIPAWRVPSELSAVDLQGALDLGVNVFECQSHEVAGVLLQAEAPLTLRAPLPLRDALAHSSSLATVVLLANASDVQAVHESLRATEYCEIHVPADLPDEVLNNLLKNAGDRTYFSGSANLLSQLCLAGQGQIDPHTVALRTSVLPAEAYGVSATKRGVAAGADADFVVLDPSVNATLKPPAYGRVIFSMSRGEILVYNDEVHQLPGSGRRLDRSSA